MHRSLFFVSIIICISTFYRHKFFSISIHFPSFPKPYRILAQEATVAYVNISFFTHTLSASHRYTSVSVCRLLHVTLFAFSGKSSYKLTDAFFFLSFFPSYFFFSGVKWKSAEGNQYLMSSGRGRRFE